MKYKRKKLSGIIFICLAMSMISACNLINPDEQTPALIKINPVTFQVVDGEGSARHKITEVWVYANNIFIGAFSPPATIPYVTDQDQTNFSFRPGIRNNGILDDAIIYPLYTTYDIELATTPGQVVEVNPVFRYKPEATFSLIADFELSNEFVVNYDTVPASQVTRSSTEPFEGNFSGEIIMSEDAYFIEVGHAISLVDLPTNGTPVYLEFQYKSETEMSIGLLGIPLNGQTFSNFFYLVRPSENWNMLYIELTGQLLVSGLPAYKVLFRSAYPSESTVPELKIQLDNIKVVHL